MPNLLLRNSIISFFISSQDVIAVNKIWIARTFLYPHRLEHESHSHGK
jgi:hypothetical protein